MFHSVFDQRRSLQSIFYAKQNVVFGITPITSNNITPLFFSLMNITSLVAKGAMAMHNAYDRLRFLRSFSAEKKDSKETQFVLTRYRELQKRAINDALKHHELLRSFNKYLLHLDWPDEDAAIPFPRQDASLISSVASAPSAHTSTGVNRTMDSNRRLRKRPRDPSDDLCYLPSRKKSHAV